MPINYELLGKRIKTARKAAKKTQDQSAEYLSVSVSYISQVERGVTKISLDTLSLLAPFIEADMAMLITGVAVEDKLYMLDEISVNAADLCPKERRMTNDFMLLLKKNRQ